MILMISNVKSFNWYPAISMVIQPNVQKQINQINLKLKL